MPDRKSKTTPTSQQEVTVSMTTSQSIITAGPLPSPEVLSAYEKACQGAAQEIIDMAKKEQAHRHTGEQKSTDAICANSLAERTAEKRGQWMAFTLVLFCLVGAIVASIFGNTIAGAILAGAPLASVITTLITRK